MVDPNRKINRLTDKDIEFLDECDDLFSDRYTDEDKEFSEHCNKHESIPPIVDNWSMSGGGGSGNYTGGSQRHHYGGGHRNEHNQRGWQRRGGGGGYRYQNRYHKRHDERAHPYNNDSHNNSSSTSGSSWRGQRATHRQQPQVEDRDRSRGTQQPPASYRRDYGNFVAAGSGGE